MKQTTFEFIANNNSDSLTNTIQNIISNGFTIIQVIPSLYKIQVNQDYYVARATIIVTKPIVSARGSHT